MKPPPPTRQCAAASVILWTTRTHGCIMRLNNCIRFTSHSRGRFIFTPRKQQHKQRNHYTADFHRTADFICLFYRFLSFLFCFVFTIVHINIYWIMRQNPIRKKITSKAHIVRTIMHRPPPSTM